MARFFVIFNPAARGEKSRRLLRFLQTKAATGDVVLAATSGPGDARRLAAEAAQAGHGCVVAAGGDGTVNEVVNGLGPEGPVLGVLPLGTVNVFAQELRLPRRLAAAWAVLAAGRTRTIDLGCATAGGSSRYFVQLAGVGFDAWAVQHASWELKKKVGPLSYIWAGLKAVAKPCGRVQVACESANWPALPERGGSSLPVSEPAAKRFVQHEGQRQEGAVVLIGNGRFYGGPFPLFPRARLDDGQLDVCVFERGGYADVLRYTAAVALGRHPRLADVRYLQAPEFTCQPIAGSAPFQLDGELAGQAPVRFTLVERALRVRTP